MSSEYDDLIMLAERRELESALAKAVRKRDEARAEVERLRGIIQEWSYPRLYVQPGAERETLLAQIQENLTGALRPKIEAAEERGAAWALTYGGSGSSAADPDGYRRELAAIICREGRKRSP